MATSSAPMMSGFGAWGIWPLLLLTSFLSVVAVSSAGAEDTGTAQGSGTAQDSSTAQGSGKGQDADTAESSGKGQGGAAQPFADLYRLYYDRGLLEYCGLVTPLAAKGFRARRDDLLARDKPTEDEQRRTRIAAGTAVDNDYLDHGLGGQRIWCRNEGKAAFDRFETYGRGAVQ